MPECSVVLAQAVTFLARCRKSTEVYEAMKRAQAAVDEAGSQPAVPLHLRNAPTKLMKQLGYGHGYQYNPAFEREGRTVTQTYLPDALEGVDFFQS